MDKLSEIMDWKRREIEPIVRGVAESELSAFQDQRDSRGSFIAALKREPGLAVISEIKRRSPSAGQIKELGSATEQAEKYLSAGADCLSILTDEKYFGGNLADLESVVDAYHRRGKAVPTLRKDFMLHPIQVLQAAQAGACAILIIVRALTDDEMRTLRTAADLAGLDALYEIHEERELEVALRHDPKILGVNNRDLAIFKTDLAFTERLVPQIPDGIVTISESGIWNREDAQRVKAAGADAVLVGEALMKADSPADLINTFHNVA